MSSSGAKSSPSVSSAAAAASGADVCPSCRLPFDKGKKRRLVDTGCGHQRCYQCMFKRQECPVCLDKAAAAAAGSGGGRSMQNGGESVRHSVTSFLFIDPDGLKLSSPSLNRLPTSAKTLAIADSSSS